MYTREWKENSIGSTENLALLEMVVENNKVKELRYNEPAVEIPEDGFVIAAIGNAAKNMEDNFKVGTSKTNSNTKNIIDKIRLKRSDLAWIGIEIKGTNAIVKIVEADLKPDIIKEEEYCNIVATKDAMIVKINAQNGTAVVKEGDIVTKGTVLIQGWLEGQFTGIRYVHANGEVQAKVWYSQKISVPLKQTKKIKTDKEENKYSVKINNFEINFWTILSLDWKAIIY